MVPPDLDFQFDSLVEQLRRVFQVERYALDRYHDDPKRPAYFDRAKEGMALLVKPIKAFGKQNPTYRDRVAEILRIISTLKDQGCFRGARGA